jgi:flagellar motility protein MotE (MotC chaperone)
MAELSIAQILSASAITIANPSKSVLDELGISKVDAGLLILAPQWFVAKKAYDWIKHKINGNQEKERMYREIIAKQQAAIKKQQEVNRELERRLRDSQASNRQNQEEIKRLKEQLKNLEDVIKLLQKAQAKAA